MLLLYRRSESGAECIKFGDLFKEQFGLIFVEGEISHENAQNCKIKILIFDISIEGGRERRRGERERRKTPFILEPEAEDDVQCVKYCVFRRM